MLFLLELYLDQCISNPFKSVNKLSVWQMAQSLMGKSLRLRNGVLFHMQLNSADYFTTQDQGLGYLASRMPISGYKLT